MVDREEIVERTMRKRKFILAAIASAMMLMSGLNSFAQVRRVQMHIGGYLCGN